MHGHEKMKSWVQAFEFEESVQSSYPKRLKRFISSDVSPPEQVIQMLIQMDMTRSDIQRLPVALHLIIAECLGYARLEPPLGFSPATYELVLRSELIEHAKIQADTFQFLNQPVVGVDDSLTPRLTPSVNECTTSETSSDDGMANIDTKLLSLRFPEDMRITEVRRLLASSEPVSIDVTQQPGVTDHEFIEEQEKQLFALCTRTMTLPMGRGMFTLRTLNPEPTESMPIPKLLFFLMNLVCAKRQPKLGQIWQMKLIDNYIANYKQSHVLFSKELVQSLVEEFNMFIQQSRDDLSQQLRRFMASPTFQANIVDNLTITDVARLVAVISYYGLTPNLLNMVDLSGTRNLLRYLYEFHKLKLDNNTIYCLVKVMQKTGD